MELSDNEVFLFCEKCKNFPKISLLTDKKSILIECNKCNKSEKVKISNIANYSSEWLISQIENSKNDGNNKENKDKYLSENIFTKKEYLCKEHNLNFLYYCENCRIEFCKKCIDNHKDHNYLNYKGLLNLKDFENFLVNVQNKQKEKYSYIYKTLIYLDNLKLKDIELKKSCNTIVSNILKIFYKDLKNENNLMILSKIIYSTFRFAEINIRL